MSEPADQVRTDRDASIRGLRTFMWGLLVDVGAAGVAFLATVIGDLEWTRVYWVMLGLGLAKSVVQGVVAFFMRKLLPPSNA